MYNKIKYVVVNFNSKLFWYWFITVDFALILTFHVELRHIFKWF